MTWLRTIGREAFGLFVDDGSLAAAIAAWLALAWLAREAMRATGPWQGIVLFAGLALILVENVRRRARRRRP